MDENESELIGMHCGDGTLYLSGKTLVWEMRGSIQEKNYYIYVKKLLKDIFSVDLNPKYRGKNSYGIQTTNKEITNFFVNNGFSPGKKVYTVRIPISILRDTKRSQCKFIRGLFDTDGCLRFEKNRTNIHYYPKLEFTSASKQLVCDLLALLDKLEFKAYTWKDRNTYRLCLAGFSNLHKFMKDVGFSNPKHFKKYYNSISLRPRGPVVTAWDC